MTTSHKLSCLLSSGIMLMLFQLAHAQSNSAIHDAIRHVLKTAPRDTTYIRNINQYVWWFYNKDGLIDRPDSLLVQTEKLLNQTKILANHLNDYSGLQRCWLNHGLALFHHNRYHPSLTYYKKAQQLINTYNLPPSDQQRVLQYMGRTYRFLNQYDTALRYHLAAIALTEKHHLTQEVDRSYWDVADILQMMGRHTESCEYIKKAYALAPFDNDRDVLWISEVYMAKCPSGANELKKRNVAISYAKRALVLVKRYGTPVYVVSPKWTDAGEKGREAFSHFVGAEKYDFSAVGPSLAA